MTFVVLINKLKMGILNELDYVSKLILYFIFHVLVFIENKI